MGKVIKQIIQWRRKQQQWLVRRIHNLTIRQRIICACVAVVLVLAAIIPTVQYLIESYRHTLDDATLKLVGKTNPNLASKLTYDQQNSQWQFNKAAITDTSSKSTDPAKNIPATLKAQLGGGGKDDDSMYAINFPTDPKKGVTFYDSQTGLSFTMTPQFKIHGGKATKDNRIVYPMAGGGQLIYTPKNNGMKEDIVLPKFIGKELAFSYKLNLPDTLSARVQADGSIGVFSIDPSLLGNVSTSSDMDAEKLKSAREQGEKNHLLFAIPAPVIVQSGDTSTKATATFGLNNHTLTVTARNMDTVTYPASIDPSVVVTSSSDFATGNNESNIDFSTDQINRGVVTGGGISGGWSSTGSGSFTARSVSGSAVYNGYLYLIGGVGPGGNNVSYAPINSNGTVGAWSDTTTLPASRLYPATVPYNGKMYVYGGYTSGTSALNTVLYANINSDGTLGSWTSASNNMASTACRFGWTGYNGYLYAVGGATGTVTSNCGNSSSTMTNTLQYAPILANGDVGAWTTSANTFTNARKDPGFAIYNGNAYMSSGTTDGVAAYRDTQIAKINSDGSIGSWRTASEQTPSPGQYRFGYQAYNGYLYMSGGTNNMTGTLYAQIYANGDIGPWQTSPTMSTGRYGHGFVLYKGYAYYFGGNDGSNNLNDTGYAKIDNPGKTSSNISTTAFGSSVNNSSGGAGFVYNGYIYYVGGWRTGGYIKDVRYAPLNSDGTVGTWANTSSLQTPITGGSGVGGAAYVIANNRIYIIGGVTNVGGSTPGIDTIQYASFNSNGTLSSWSFNPTNYVATISDQEAIYYNGYIYMRGLTDGMTNADRVYRAPVNTDGTLGSWTWINDGNLLPSPVLRAPMLVYGGYIYSISGWNSSTNTYTSAVQYAKINSDGSIGTWTTGTSLNTSRKDHGATIVNGYMYVYGGNNASGDLSSTEYAKINSDGSIGTWTTGPNLSITFDSGGYASYGDKIYLISGEHNGSLSKNVYYLTARSGGSGAIGSWSTASNSLATPFPNGIAYNNMFAYGGYLYTVGGISNSSYVPDTWSAPINPDGSTGTWTQQASMPIGRANFVLDVWGGYVYACAGSVTGGSNNNDCTYAKLQSNGGLGSWSSVQTMNLAAGSVPVRIRASGAAHNGYLYVLGGGDSSVYNTVYYAPINASTGALGTWQAGSSFTTARGSAAAFAANGYLYIAGGSTNVSGSGGYLDDVQVAPLNPSDGSVGTWQMTTALVQPRALFVLSAANGYVYVYGGTNTVGGLTTVEQAPILAGGQLGAWNRSGNTAFSSARSGGTGTIANGYLYLSSGRNSGGTFFSDVQYTPLAVQPRTATYSRLFDLGALYSLTDITYGGVLQGGKDSISYRTAGANGVFGSTSRASSLGGASTVCSTGDVRYIFVMVQMDDVQRATLSDEAGAQSYISNLAVSYSQNHAPTDKRLAHGKYFESETLQPLDTCAS